MRISTAYQYDAFTNEFDLANQRVQIFSQQVASGKRITAPGDDPVGTAQSLSLRKLRADVTQYNANLSTGKGILGFSESALGDASSAIQQAYQLALRGASSATDQIGRNAMAAEVTSIQQRLLQVANSQGPSGQYIFAGQNNATQPYALSGATITYSGDANSLSVQTGPGSTMVVTTQAEPMFSDAYNKLETLKNNLLGGNIGALSGVSVNDMQSAQSSFDQARGAAGAKMQSIDDLTSQYTKRVDDLTAGISDVEDVDMSQAILNLQQAQTVYQASLSAASRSFGNSLLNFIQNIA